MCHSFFKKLVLLYLAVEYMTYLETVRKIILIIFKRMRLRPGNVRQPDDSFAHAFFPSMKNRNTGKFCG